MHAYMVMYPQATMDDLKKAFPDELNPDSGVKKNFVKAGEKGTEANWDGFFQKEDELLTMGDGSKVAVVKMWTKPSFERLVSHAAQYGIEIAQFEAAEKGIGQKGSFRLEYLNGYVPPVPVAKKPNWWLWLLIAAAIIIVLAFLLMRSCNKEPKVVEKVVTETVVVHDTVTVYLEQIEEIEKNFNAAKFEAGKADLNDDAKFVLHDLVKILNKQPQLRLKIEGHTSDEGDVTFNQTLSETRAKAVVDFLVSQGVAADRLEYEGKGSSEPLDPNNREVNRRTEIIVLE
jgi:outer membrane protein OmpA-like peptidoglycan-associated protein